MAILDLNAAYAAGGIDDNDSRKTMVYTSDSGKEYSVEISEAIGEVFGFRDFVTADIGNVSPLPKRAKMRQVHFTSANRKVSASYPIGKPSEPIYKEGGTVLVPRKAKAGGLVLAATGVTGEKFTLPKAEDSGQSNNDLD